MFLKNVYQCVFILSLPFCSTENGGLPFSQLMVSKSHSVPTVWNCTNKVHGTAHHLALLVYFMIHVIWEGIVLSYSKQNKWSLHKHGRWIFCFWARLVKIQTEDFSFYKFAIQGYCFFVSLLPFSTQLNESVLAWIHPVHYLVCDYLLWCK